MNNQKYNNSTEKTGDRSTLINHISKLIYGLDTSKLIINKDYFSELSSYLSILFKKEYPDCGINGFYFSEDFISKKLGVVVKLSDFDSVLYKYYKKYIFKDLERHIIYFVNTEILNKNQKLSSFDIILDIDDENSIQIKSISSDLNILNQNEKTKYSVESLLNERKTQEKKEYNDLQKIYQSLPYLEAKLIEIIEDILSKKSIGNISENDFDKIFILLNKHKNLIIDCDNNNNFIFIAFLMLYIQDEFDNSKYLGILEKTKILNNLTEDQIIETISPIDISEIRNFIYTYFTLIKSDIETSIKAMKKSLFWDKSDLGKYNSEIYSLKEMIKKSDENEIKQEEKEYNNYIRDILFDFIDLIKNHKDMNFSSLIMGEYSQDYHHIFDWIEENTDNIYEYNSFRLNAFLELFNFLKYREITSLEAAENFLKSKGYEHVKFDKKFYRLLKEGFYYFFEKMNNSID